MHYIYDIQYTELNTNGVHAMLPSEQEVWKVGVRMGIKNFFFNVKPVNVKVT